MADISIKDVCRGVEVSEGTFFNYFPRKIDLIYYFHQLFDYKMIYKTRQRVRLGKYLDLIDTLFQMVAGEFEHPTLMLEFISIITGEKEHPGKLEIPALEIAFALPECPGIEKDPACLSTLEEFFLQTLRLAVEHKELPKKINIEDMCIHLFSILVGASVALEPKMFPQLGRYYADHLKLLWKAVERT